MNIVEYVYEPVSEFSQKNFASKDGIYMGPVLTKMTEVKIGNLMKNKDGKFWLAGGSSTYLTKFSILCDNEKEAIEKYLAKPSNLKFFKDK